MSNLRDDTFWDGPSQEPLLPKTGKRTRGKPTTKAERMETRGRARALQALYAADVRDQAQLRRIATTVFDDLAVIPEEREFASRLVATVADNVEALDAALAEVTNNWRLERLGVIERCVLRLAAAEMARNETPVKVVLQEAVHLAERYGTERSARFVNGVLDAYARKLGKL
ncbi:transcription antitermination factor NusB [Gemmatimonas sp.]|uniref:transcription antitermination factor NusB n=1 Tax=Gemmatimonas sp. TaxID=1962908 RepID=UPI0037C0CC2B